MCGFFLDNISFAKLCKDARMLVVQRNHVTQMNRYPSGVIGVTQSEEPRNKCGQCVYDEEQVSLSYRSHVDHHLQFQLHDNGPKQEETTGLSSLITPVFQ